jgi:hypothetical protein
MGDRAYCPGCNRSIRLVTTPEHRDGHASLPDGADVVCLDFGAGCTEGRCPVTGAMGIVMGVRLAKSHLRDEAFQTVRATCQACDNVAELEILDDSHVFCPICEATSRWALLAMDDDGGIALTLE